MGTSGYTWFSDGHLDEWGSLSAGLSTQVTFPKPMDSTPTFAGAYPYYASGDTKTYWPLVRAISQTEMWVLHGRWGDSGNLIYDTNVAKQWYARGYKATNKQAVYIIKY